MEVINSVVETILNVGPVVLMPVVLLILGLAFRIPLLKALRSAITVGVGFAGIYLLIGFFMDTIAPAATAFAERMGSNLTVIDVGWPVTAAIAWAAPIAYLFIPVGVVVNVAMLALGWTRTLDINLWDYWHFIFAASIFYVITGSTLLSLAIAAVLFAFILIMADRTQSLVASYFNLPGISFPLAGNVEWWLVAKPVDKLLDRVSFLKEVRFTPEYVQERLGVIGEPVFQGAVYGMVLGILAGYSWDQVLLLGINLAAAVVLLPRMVAVLMEALVPIADAAGAFMRKYAGGRELYIGMDSAIGTGQSAVVANAILMVPVTIILALILPGNKVLPLADLSALVFPLMFAVATVRGDLVRSFIISVVFMIIGLYTATAFAPYVSMAAEATNVPLPDMAAGAVGITSVAQAGFEPYTVIIAKILEILF